jgi:Zn-finger nucleic acid-binding protein
MPDEEKIIRYNEIKDLLLDFAKKYLNEEYTRFVLNLLDRLNRKRTISITRGQAGIWAGAIVHVIARINFLFDKSNDFYITADQIADFFACSKSTLGQKATLIERECKASFHDPELCREEIVDRLTIVQTPSGFFIPLGMLKKQINQPSPQERARQQQLNEQKRQEAEAAKREAAAAKRKEKFKDQKDLFSE